MCDQYENWRLWLVHSINIIVTGSCILVFICFHCCYSGCKSVTVCVPLISPLCQLLCRPTFRVLNCVEKKLLNPNQPAILNQPFRILCLTNKNCITKNISVIATELLSILNHEVKFRIALVYTMDLLIPLTFLNCASSANTSYFWQKCQKNTSVTFVW